MDIKSHAFSLLLNKRKRYLNREDRKNFALSLLSDKSSTIKLPRFGHLIVIKPQIVDDIKYNAEDITKITIFDDYRLPLKGEVPRTKKDMTAYDLGKFVNLRKLILVGDSINYKSILETADCENITSLTIIADRSIGREINGIISAFGRLREFYLYNSIGVCEKAAAIFIENEFPYAVLVSNKETDRNFLIEQGRDVLEELESTNVVRYMNLYKRHIHQIKLRLNKNNKIDLRDFIYYSQVPGGHNYITLSGKSGGSYYDNKSCMLKVFKELGVNRYELIGKENIPAEFSCIERLSINFPMIQFENQINFDESDKIWPNITELRLEGWLNINRIPEMPHLEKLHIESAAFPLEVHETLSRSPIKYLSIRLSGDIEKLNIFQYFRGVRVLKIENTSPIDISSVFKYCKKLKELRIINARYIDPICAIPDNVLVYIEDPIHRNPFIDEQKAAKNYNQLKADLSIRPQFKYLRHFEDIPRGTMIFGKYADSFIEYILADVSRRFNGDF